MPAIESAAIPIEQLTGRHWWLCQTRPLYEARLVRDLRGYDVGAFLPMTRIRRTKTSRGRTYQVEEARPLFPTYVFVHVRTTDSKEKYPPIPATRSIATIKMIPVTNQKQLSLELLHIERALEIDPTLGAQRTMKAGQRCRITSGPFQGAVGIVEADGDRRFLHLSVSMLGSTVPVEVSLDCVEAV